MKCCLIYQAGPQEWEVEDDEYHDIPVLYEGMKWKQNREVNIAFTVSELCYVSEGRYYEVYLKPFKISTGEMLHEKEFKR